MDKKFLEATKMLNYQSQKLQKLIKSRKWNELDEYNKIKSVYDFVQNEILLGYNREDTLTAEQVLTERYGQCNTKATLLMALLRGVGIPCRLHGFEGNGEATYIQNAAIVTDLGIWNNPDEFFSKYTQNFYEGKRWTPSDVKQWRKENGYTWHERNDRVICDLVPTKINRFFGHLGGVSECKKCRLV